MLTQSTTILYMTWLGATYLRSREICQLFLTSPGVLVWVIFVFHFLTHVHVMWLFTPYYRPLSHPDNHLLLLFIFAFIKANICYIYLVDCRIIRRFSHLLSTENNFNFMTKRHQRGKFSSYITNIFPAIMDKNQDEFTEDIVFDLTKGTNY